MSTKFGTTGGKPTAASSRELLVAVMKCAAARREPLVVAMKCAGASV
jgi:hypothetical protein